MQILMKEYVTVTRKVISRREAGGSIGSRLGTDSARQRWVGYMSEIEPFGRVPD